MELTEKVNTITVLTPIWEKILDVKNVGPGANFFALGGHSLMAVEMVARIEEQLGVEITMKDILEHPELNQLAEFIAKLDSSIKVSHPASTAIYDSLFPLSPNQRHLWNLVSLSPQDITHNISNAIRIRRKLDITLINEVLNHIFLENESLRTTFLKNENGVFQKIKPFSPMDLKFIPLKEHEIKNVLSLEMEKVFHLEQDELVQVKFYQLAEDDFIFFFMAHHIVWDGISNIVFFNTFLEKYENGILETSSKKSGSYAEYVYFLEEYFKAPEYLEKLSFWKEKFNSIDVVPFFKRDNEGETHLNGSSVLNMRIEEELLVKAEEYVRERGISLYHLFFSCFHFLLFQKNGSNSQIVGTPVHGRSNRKFRKTLGFFINTLPFIHHLNPEKKLRDNLNSIIQNLAESFYNQDVPFEHLLKKTRANQLLTNHALFQTLFVYLDVTQEMKLFDGKEFELVKIDRKSTHCEVDFYLYKAEKFIDVVIEYRKNLFSQMSMDSFFQDYIEIVRTIVTNDQITLEEIKKEKIDKKKSFIDIVNLTLNPPHVIPSFIDTIFEQIRSKKSQIAISSKNWSLEYSDLEKYTAVISEELQKAGIQKGDVVGIYLERDQFLVPALLATLHSGAIYLPLDPSFPQERLQYMAQKSSCKIIISTQSLDSQFLTSKKIIVQDLDFDSSPSLIASNIRPSDSAYLLFTSGSTGNPKGVEVTHENISNFLLSMSLAPGMKNTDKLLAVTTISFDISVLELFLPLYVGASVYLATKDEVIDPREIKKIIIEKDISIMQATPVTWRMLLKQDSSSYSNLKVLCGGEALDKTLANDLVTRCGEVWNMYGPTETTVWSSIKKIEATDIQITIGHPILNTYFLILDDKGQRLYAGEKGRLFIGGKGISRGYFQENKLTAERFISHPDNKSEIIYDTGDIAFYNEAGEVICLGRADNQVKVRGYRIELGEIEEAILKENNVFEVACKVIDDEIYAFVSLKDKSKNIEDISSNLIRKIPRYMIPKRLIVIDELPKTPNDKIDRKQLNLAPLKKTKTELIEENFEIKTIVKGVWEKHLKLNHFSDDESFFNLGGHSLIALDIFNQINAYFNISLDLSSLFTHHSVSKLSSLVNEKIQQKNESLKGYSYVVKINEESHNSEKIFCFHGVGGNVLNYYPLAGALKGFNFYGVQASGLNGKDRIISSIPEMARAYIKEMKSIQPQGPYLLAGGSMGGMIAIEVASQLVRNGDEVEHVFMFDTFGPELKLDGDEFHFENLPQRIVNKVRSKWKHLLFLSQVYTHKLKGKAIPHYIRYQFISYKNLKAMQTFNPDLCHFPVTLIRARQELKGVYLDPYLGWESILKGKLKIIEIAGDHSSFIETQDFLETLKASVSTYKDK